MIESQKRKRSKVIKIVAGTCILICASPLIGELVIAALNSIFVDFGHFAPDMNYVHCVKKLMTDHDRQILTMLALLLIGCGLLSWATRLHIEITEIDTNCQRNPYPCSSWKWTIRDGTFYGKRGTGYLFPGARL